MAENRAARSMTASRKEEELLDMEIKTKVVVAWIEGLLGEKLPNQPLRDVLHDGVVLCKLANVMKPGCIRKFHRRPKMLMMKMENIAFFLNVAKTRFNVQPTVLFSPTDVHDESSPTSLLKVLRVLLLLRNECPGNAVIDEDLLKALASSNIETDAAEPEPEPEAAPEPTPEPEPEPTPEDDEDAEMLEAEKMAQEAAEAAKRALEAAKAAQERAKAAAQERAAAAAAERERVAAEKVAAEKAAQEKAAADKAAAEKAAADKAAQERAAADKAAADALAAEKSAAQAAASAKAAADKAAADKLAADNRANADRAAAEKLAAEKLAAQKRAQAASTPAASTPAATNGAKSAASSLNGVAVQEQVLEEVVKCIHSELSVESKHELRSALHSYLEPIQQQLMYSSDKDLRVLCKDMGLADVPENKERKWYVDWILHQGRSS